MPATLSSLDFIPPGYVNQGASALVTLGFLGIGGLLSLVVMAVRIRTLRAAQARENALHRQKPGPLSGGPTRVIRGTVEVDGGDDVAIEVTITQTAQNHTSKNSRSHSWKESARSVKSRPFTLVTEAGERIQVEPGEQVLVADGLVTEKAPNNKMNRLRRCDVKRGEVFTVYGDLHPPASGGGGAYRGAATGWTLKPARETGRMLLATETITERYVPRMQFLSTWVVILSAVWLLFNGFVTLPFAATAFWGKQATATVTNTSTYITTSKSSKTTHYVVEAATASGKKLKGEVVRPTYNRILGEKNDQKIDAVIPVLLGPSEFPDYLGTEAHLSGILLAMASAIWFAAIVVVWSRYTAKTAWYDLEQLNEPGGTGHWPQAAKNQS